MRLRKTACLLATAVMLGASAPALAATLSNGQARQASTAAAKIVAKETHAASVKVTGCSRMTSRKSVCHAEAHYKVGANRCTFDVTVIQAASKSQPPRATPSNFVCY